MELFMFLIKILIAILTFAMIVTENNIKENIADVSKKVDDKLKKKKSYYEKNKLFLSQMGAKEIFGDISPAIYIFINILSALISFIVIYTIKPKIAILGFVGFFIPGLILKLSNKMDNEEIIEELSIIYSMLKIQAKAGVFILEMIEESYYLAKNDRLKSALLELYNAMQVKTASEAIDEFNNKFKSSEIDMFCVVLKQGIASGETSSMFASLNEQVKAIENAKRIKLKENIKTKLAFNQLFIYVALIVLILYGVIQTLGDSLTIF